MNTRLKIIGAAAVGLLLLYGFLVEPYWIEVRHLHLEDENIDASLIGKTALHMTDLHVVQIGKRERKVIDIIEETNPDYVFLTGDYVPWNGDYAPALEFLKLLGDRSKVLAVMGDYDYSNSRKSCLFCHEPGSAEPQKGTSVRFLRNTTTLAGSGYKGSIIAGIDGDFDRAFEKRGNIFSEEGRRPGVILAHDPKLFEKMDRKQKALVLAGNTHGGQIPLPSWIWRLLGYEKNADYNSGLFREGNKLMYVSRGIGTSHVPFRLFCRPEVVVIHF